MTTDPQKRKQFSVYLDQTTFEDFIRIFPGQGTRQIFIRATIHEVIRQVSNNPELVDLPEAVKKVLNMPAMKIRTSGGM